MKFREYLRIAPLVLAAAFGTLGGLKSCDYENRREGCVPLGFSEIHQIEIDALKENRIDGEGVNNEGKGIAATYYLAGLNDLTMKIFECWNTANTKEENIYGNFAQELKKRFDPANKKHHYELGDLFDIVPSSIPPYYELNFRS